MPSKRVARGARSRPRASQTLGDADASAGASCWPARSERRARPSARGANRARARSATTEKGRVRFARAPLPAPGARASALRQLVRLREDLVLSCACGPPVCAALLLLELAHARGSPRLAARLGLLERARRSLALKPASSSWLLLAGEIVRVLVRLRRAWSKSSAYSSACGKGARAGQTAPREAPAPEPTRTITRSAPLGSLHKGAALRLRQKSLAPSLPELWVCRHSALRCRWRLPRRARPACSSVDPAVEPDRERPDSRFSRGPSRCCSPSPR